MTTLSLAGMLPGPPGKPGQTRPTPPRTRAARGGDRPSVAAGPCRSDGAATAPQGDGIRLRAMGRTRHSGRIALLCGLLSAVWACSPAPDLPAAPPGPGSGQPFLTSDGAGVWMSWLEPAPAGHRLAVSYFEGSWTDPVTVAEGEGFFVNWADFPSIRVVGDRLVAHWLWRRGPATYDYGVRLAWSEDGGATWSEPWTPHEDETPTEHGFVSVFADGDVGWAAWLDGRAMVEPSGPMSLRARSLPPGGTAGPAGAGPENLLDARACECCQTSAVVAAGIPVVAFRDRAEGEVRDIHVTRRLEDGWTGSSPVHEDGWVIGGCPVNGPSAAALDELVAVAWFTAPDGEAQVNVAFSADAAASFGPPARLDAGRPLGRVDVVLLDDGSALVTWLEEEGAGTEASILSRRVTPEGVMGEPRRLAGTEGARASGFPRIARLGGERVLLAWTDPRGTGRVRVSVFALDGWEAPS